jgi:heme-degrading monooxygenase HmoA
MSLLATTRQDFDRFERTFATKGAAKRKLHGSKGSTIFRDPDQTDRVLVVFDWDLEGWQKFISDPEVPAILKEAGLKGTPEVAELGGQYTA